MFAAELLVKNAVIPLSFKHVKTKGYGFLLKRIATIIGFAIKATVAMDPTRSSISSPYSMKIFNPLRETALYTRDMIPIGANCIIQFTT